MKKWLEFRFSFLFCFRLGSVQLFLSVLYLDLCWALLAANLEQSYGQSLVSYSLYFQQEFLFFYRWLILPLSINAVQKHCRSRRGFFKTKSFHRLIDWNIDDHWFRKRKKQQSMMFTMQYYRGVYLIFNQSIMLNLLTVKIFEEIIKGFFMLFFDEKWIDWDADLTILRRLGFGSFIYMNIFSGLEYTITFLVFNRFNWDRLFDWLMRSNRIIYVFFFLLFSMQQGKMFFMIGLCMALIQGGYVRRIPHGNEIKAAMTVSCTKKSYRLQEQINKGFNHHENDMKV